MKLSKERILRGVRLRICRNIYFDSNTDIRNSVLICGSGRSGTTWLGEVINSRNEYRTIFEPFHPGRVKAWGKYNHRYYLSAGNNDQFLFSDVSKILTGEIRDKWSATHNTRLISSRRIIKEISMNNSLPYFKLNFPDLKVIYIHRNPFDVARSRILLGWHKENDPTVVTDLSVFSTQPVLMKDFLHSFQDILEDGTLTDMEKEIAFWCAENYIPLNHMTEDDMFLKVSYDALLANPLEEFSRIFDFLSLKLPEDLLKRINIPSTTSSGIKQARRTRETTNDMDGRSQWILQQFALGKFAF